MARRRRVTSTAEQTEPSTAAAVRTVEVKPPSARQETLFVLRAAFHIAYWSVLLVGTQVSDPSRALASGAAAAPEASPFERRFQDLDSPAQRLFRELGEGITEAEARRSQAGAWPSVESLAGEGIPPFAAGPIDRAGYSWTLLATRTVINYVGTPAPDSGRPTVLVIITEPDPGTPIDPQARTDEIHHRLADGTMIHVGVWMGPRIAPPREPIASGSYQEGFQQILGSPSTTLN